MSLAARYWNRTVEEKTIESQNQGGEKGLMFCTAFMFCTAIFAHVFNFHQFQSGVLCYQHH